MKALKKFMQDESGASAVEYGLLVALIAVVIIAAVSTLGKTISNSFTSTSSAIAAAT